MARRRKKNDPKATTFDQIDAQGVGDTLKNRNVFDDQQVARSTIDKRQTRTSRTVVSVIVGVVVMLLVWGVWSIGQFAISSVGDAMGSKTVSTPFYERESVSITKSCYQIVDEKGEALEGTPCYETEDEAKAHPPQWYQDANEKLKAQHDAEMAGKPDGLVGYLLVFELWKVLVSLLGGLIACGLLYTYLMRNLDSQNLMNDTTDINQYHGDQHVTTPDELVRKFEWFPDVGGHSAAQPSSMMSHVMLTNKGLKKVTVGVRADKDILDDDGDVEYYKGQILRDDDGEYKTTTAPMIDEKFGDALFDASGMPKDKKIRRFFDATQIPYNADGSDREKLGKYKTVADMINAEWDVPLFEPQRPGGAYIVDTAPVNTMVLAITRAGKGQTYIEPMIDIWLREKRPNNMVINDPKGELLVKHYVRATMRGFQVIQFNLINPLKTDIYNPLGLASDAAREGDSTKTAMYVENIADVFFPLDGGEDPMWPSAANNAFKRAAYGLIDYYLEEERELRAQAQRIGMNPKVLENKVDAMWGKVTLYNCYQLFVQLAAKKMKNPVKDVEDKAKAGEYGTPKTEDFDDEAYEEAMAEAESKAFMWEDKPELDMLTLFFNATSGLPQNSMRKLVGNADSALRAMGAAEKMLASVYGIAITAMSFFTDPTISTLTSGTPSQNVDLGGLSFPRRMGVRFAANYLKRDHLIGTQAKWDAFEDDRFEKSLGKDFEHEDIVAREGWARYYFVGKFENETAYVRLRLVNPQSGMLIRTLYFRFTKDYQTTLSGRHFVKDPITDKKIIKNGILVELQKQADGSFAVGHTTYPQMRLVNIALPQPEKEEGEANAIISTNVRYSENPKAVFLVTPPHLMKYAKLILILVKQLVDLNFDKSYMTKGNQKPLFKTRFMLDELGNLQSEGNGISGFETMLSIGLGQEQQFTLILQTLQQLRAVYGDDVDKIVQGNVSNIIFLKSTDDAMIETLEKMSGKRHVVYRDSKTVTKDVGEMLKVGNVESKVSYTMSAKEEAVISYNDMAFIAERNSIIFRAGDSPVWNRNETILPMSWRMFGGSGENSIVHPGHTYSLQTIPTLSSAIDFDVRQNQPDFQKMLSKRMAQAVSAIECKVKYAEAYDYKDVDIARLDPDVYADEVMELVDAAGREDLAEELGISPDAVETTMMEEAYIEEDWEANLEQADAIKATEAKVLALRKKIYAEGKISREMFMYENGGVKEGPLDSEIVEAYKSCRPDLEHDDEHFRVSADGSLYSADGRTVYIRPADETSTLRRLKEAASNGEERVFTEDQEDIELAVGFEVEKAFYEMLGDLDSWQGLANGEFDRAMARAMDEVENRTVLS